MFTIPVLINFMLNVAVVADTVGDSRECGLGRRTDAGINWKLQITGRQLIKLRNFIVRLMIFIVIIEDSVLQSAGDRRRLWWRRTIGHVSIGDAAQATDALAM